MDIFPPLISEIVLSTGYPSGYIQLCTLGISSEVLYAAEKKQLSSLCLEEKILVILKKDYHVLLDELISDGEIELGERVTSFYEKFKYDNLFQENKTTHHLEILILNHDLRETLEDKPQGKTIKI